MAKTKISEWSATPANNTDIDGINIAEGCAPSGINDAIREMMAQVKDLYSGTTGDATAIAGGGTGATTASAARTNLGVAVGTDVLPVANPSYTGTLTGGTGVVNIGSGQVYKDASGNVGIGTSSPLTKLHVQNSDVAFTPDTGADFLIVENNGTAAIQIVASTTGKSELFFSDTTRNIGGYSYDHSSNYLATFVNGSERARIDSSGNLLVGTTNAIIWNTTNTGVAIGSASAPAIQVSRSGDVALLLNRIASDGQIQAFARQGAQVGNISVTTSATSYNTSSDYRLKENIQPMTGALAKVVALKPVTYNWKADGSDGEGFIAHELAEVVPQCVTGKKDALDAEGKPVYQGIDTSFLVATLTAAIQELKAIVDAQGAEIAALKGQA